MADGNPDIEAKLPALRAQWQNGSASALIKAFVWCAGNEQPFPQWLLDAVFNELVWCRDNRPRYGTKTTGNSAALERNEMKQTVRFRLVQQFLDFQQTEIDAGRRTASISGIEAARSAQEFLIGRNHPAQGSPDSIYRSYKRLKSG